jgi:VanZ family protein
MKLGQKYYNYLFYHFPWQLLVIIIFVVSSISQQHLPAFTQKISDKILHFSAFGALGLLMVHSFKHSRNSVLQKYAGYWAVIFTSIYGIFDELHQILVPGRLCSFADWLADTIGALLLVLIFMYFLYHKNKQPARDEPGQKNDVSKM